MPEHRAPCSAALPVGEPFGGGLRSRPSVDRALAPLPIGSTNLELLELSRGSPRELVAELDRRRAFEVRECLSAVLDELVLRRLGPRLAHDERLHGLAPLL